MNNSIEEILPELKDIAESNSDVSLEFNALKVSDAFRWLYKDIRKLEDFVWHEIHAVGKRNIGKALNELNQQLRYGGFFVEYKKYFRPIIFLLTDGSPDDDYAAPQAVRKLGFLLRSTQHLVFLAFVLRRILCLVQIRS